MKAAQEKFGGSFMGIMVNIVTTQSSNYSNSISTVSNPLNDSYWPVGETVEVGNFDPKIATFWIDSGKSLTIALART